MTDQDLQRCLYAIGIEKRLAQGEFPESPFDDVACLLCYDKPERQSGILCHHYISQRHKDWFERLFKR